MNNNEETTPNKEQEQKIDKLIAKKNPNKIAIKFINTTLIMYWNLNILYQLFYKNK